PSGSRPGAGRCTRGRSARPSARPRPTSAAPPPTPAREADSPHLTELAEYTECRRYVARSPHVRGDDRPTRQPQHGRPRARAPRRPRADPLRCAVRAHGGRRGPGARGAARGRAAGAAHRPARRALALRRGHRPGRPGLLEGGHPRRPRSVAVRGPPDAGETASGWAADCEAVWALVASLVLDRTDAQWRVVDAVDAADTQAAAAAALDITPSSVTGALRLSRIREERA